MSDSVTVGGTSMRLTRDDITTLDTECFVFYARPDLKLGSGFGTAIGVRGGPSVQEELNGHGPCKVTEVVTTRAGDLKARLIIHAVGPAFQEPDSDAKLAVTVRNVLKEADRQGVTRLALPAMGVGFYGIPLGTCAGIMLDAIQDHLSTTKTSLKEVVICVLDNRELKAFQERFGQPASI